MAFSERMQGAGARRENRQVGGGVLSRMRGSFAFAAMNLILILPLGCQTLKRVFVQNGTKHREQSNESHTDRCRKPDADLNRCESVVKAEPGFQVSVPFFVEARVRQTVDYTICSVNAGGSGVRVICAGSF